MEERIRHEVRRCVAPGCGLRYPVTAGRGGDCPRCGGATELVVEPYGELVAPRSEAGMVPCEVLVDNVRSLYNVGSLFRTASGAGVARLHLCGITPTPDNPRLHKTALGAERQVSWTYHADGLQAALRLRNEGYALWALEGGREAGSLFGAPRPDEPFVLVVGNEVSGVDPAILAECARVLAIPMAGGKTSLNVAVAFGIAAYALRYGF